MYYLELCEVSARHGKVSTNIFVLNLWLTSIEMNSAPVQSVFSGFFFWREIILRLSFSSCQYRFAYFLLVYPVSNLELCEVSHSVVLHFFFT